MGEYNSDFLIAMDGILLFTRRYLPEGILSQERGTDQFPVPKKPLKCGLNARNAIRTPQRTHSYSSCIFL